MNATSADRRDDVVRLLADAPAGLSDGELARALGADVRPQTVNALCRRMATAGLVERTGTRPIRNRLLVAVTPTDPPTDPPTPEEPDAGSDTPAALGASHPGIGSPTVADAEPEPTPAPDVGEAHPSRDDPPAGQETDEAHPGRDDPPVAPKVDDARPGREDPPVAPKVDDARPGRDDPPAGPGGDDALRPVRLSPDALQAWSRTVNVQAAVASWLRGRGATIRSATVDGTTPARDLVARLDGADLHVEVTGWPPDGDRTHPTTIAADWFSAATRAAVRRRGDRPHARIVIALPDTRRYRALAAHDAALAGARTEVWFVDPSGAVQESS